MGILYVVATPIGNLEDISLRALRILSEADLILCEDTRQTQKLLNFYKIKKPTLSYHQHTGLNKTEYILELLKSGKNLALVSDAGTPGISDPGGKLVALATKENIQVLPVPGASALTSIISISGVPLDRFIFLGFLPHKKNRKKFIAEIINSKYPVIFYESPYRIIKTLKELLVLSVKKEVVVGRELTKKFETVLRGDLENVLKNIESDKINSKGEFVVIVY